MDSYDLYHNQSYTITWDWFTQHESNAQLEDPIDGSFIPLEEYTSIYNKFLTTLDGTYPDAFVDFYFARSPICALKYEFVDNDAREDFRDIVLEMGCIPSIKSIMSGECNELTQENDKKDIDLQRRISAERDKIAKRNLRQINKKYNTEEAAKIRKINKFNDIEKKQMILKQIQKSIADLEHKISNEHNIGKKSKLITKMNKIKRRLDEFE